MRALAAIGLCALLGGCASMPAPKLNTAASATAIKATNADIAALTAKCSTLSTLASLASHFVPNSGLGKAVSEAVIVFRSYCAQHPQNISQAANALVRAIASIEMALPPPQSR